MAGLNFGGDLFGGETGGFPTPLSNQTALNFATSSETTLYTVPTGKRFFITSCSLQGRGTGSAGGAAPTITANSKVIASLWYESMKDSAAANVAAWQPVFKTFGVPIQLDAGDTIVTGLAGLGNDQIYFNVEGWEE